MKLKYMLGMDMEGVRGKWGLVDMIILLYACIKLLEI